MTELDDATVEAIAAEWEAWGGMPVNRKTIRAIAPIFAKHLPDPRPTEAEVYEGFRGDVPVRGWDIWEYLRSCGCFRPEPTAHVCGDRWCEHCPPRRNDDAR